MLIQALEQDFETIVISLLPQDEINGTLPVIPGAASQYAAPLPEFSPMSLRAVAGAIHPYPRALVSTWDPKTAQKMYDIAVQHNVALAIGTDIRTLRYLNALPETVVKILDEPDVSPFVSTARDEPVRPWMLRAVLREKKYRHFLKAHAPSLHTAIVASEQEAIAYQTLANHQAVNIVENSAGPLPNVYWQPVGSQKLLFTGSITYGTNAEGIRFFINDVLPGLASRVSNLQLVVTGSLPERIPANMRNPHVRLTGRLDSLEDQYLNSRLFVAPILSGTGTRIKLLEAMSYGMPIVSTSKGAEGLPVHHEVHLLIADDGEAFAAAILRLLDEPELSRTLGQNGRELVEREFTGERQRAQIRKIVHELLSRKQG